jgi:hypothetical protein
MESGDGPKQRSTTVALPVDEKKQGVDEKQGGWKPFYRHGQQGNDRMGRQRQQAPCEGYTEKTLSRSCCPCRARKCEAMRRPCGEEKGRAPAHGTARLNGSRREASWQARRCMCAGGAARLVVEPSALGIRGDALMAGGRQRLHKAQWHEATARRVRG